MDREAADLLATARAALKAEVLPELEGRASYAARMALNALAIAERRLSGATERVAAARAGLRAFAPDAAALAAGLRSGAIPRTPALHAALVAAARAETEAANPAARALGLQGAKGSTG